MVFEFFFSFSSELEFVKSFNDKSDHHYEFTLPTSSNRPQAVATGTTSIRTVQNSRTCQIKHPMYFDFNFITVNQGALPNFIQEWKENDNCSSKDSFPQFTSIFLTHNSCSIFHVLPQ